MRNVIALGALLLFPSLALGQGPPGTNIAVDVAVTEIIIRGDRVRVGYVLENSAGSSEDLFVFSVDAPSPVLSIPRPEPEQAWRVSTFYREHSVAKWTTLGVHLAPGESSPALVFEALGVPAIVTYRVLGWTPVPPLTDMGPVVAPSDPLYENSVLGQTVGIEPFPLDQSPLSLLRRLQAVTDETCGELGWISNAGVCNSLTRKLGNAEEALTRGRPNAGRGQLGALLNELDAQRGQHVSESAYWLLSTNAEVVLSVIERS